MTTLQAVREAELPKMSNYSFYKVTLVCSLFTITEKEKVS